MLGARWLGFACRALRETSPFPPRAAESSAVVDATVAPTGQRHRPHLVQRLRVLPLGAGLGFGQLRLQGSALLGPHRLRHRRL